MNQRVSLLMNRLAQKAAKPIGKFKQTDQDRMACDLMELRQHLQQAHPELNL